MRGKMIPTRIVVRMTAAIAAGLVGLASPRSGVAQDDKAAVVATIKAFLGALSTRDTTVLSAHIDSTTRFTLIRPGPSGSRITVVRGGDFVQAVARPNQPPFEEPIRNPVVHVDGDLASVWTEYQVRRGGEVTHCGFDAFHLARLGGKWKIINVSDSFRPTGCGEAWKD
jgi:hypothetical protein